VAGDGWSFCGPFPGGIQAAGLLAVAAIGASAWGAPPPNVLVLIADQWRACAFGYTGDPNAKTPHVDRLAARSMRFLNAVSGMPVCCPARASIMTGQRPLTTGIFLNDARLAANAVSIGRVMGAAGYDTAYVGKWHLDGGIRTNYIPPPRRQGFEYWKANECTHDYNHSLYYADSPVPLQWEGYDALAQTRDVERYLHERVPGGKPFLLFLAWGPPHNPYDTAPAKYRALFNPDEIRTRPNVPPESRAAVQKRLAGYYAHCAALDGCLGDLLATLRATGLETNTLIVFTADHGDMLGSHGEHEKQQPYDEANHVPLLLYWPAGFGVAGRSLDAVINSEDLMPTILGLCGIPVPRGVEGLDYSGYVQGGPSPSDGAALLSCVSPFGTWPRREGGREYRGIRTARYTYVRSLAGPWLLFDNQTDPCQLSNLVGLPAQAKLEAELEAVLHRKLAETHDDFLAGAAYLAKWGYHVDELGNLPH